MKSHEHNFGNPNCKKCGCRHGENEPCEPCDRRPERIAIVEEKYKYRSKGEEEFWQYVTQSPYALEVIDDPLYSTDFYVSGETTELHFFIKQFNHIALSNQWIIGMLPNPMAFLIETIRIEGVIQNIKYGACSLQIGNKNWLMSPAWTFGLKEKGYRLKHPLIIPPLVSYKFEIRWQQPEKLGIGVSGLEKMYQPIQVVMGGSKARAIN